MSGLSGKWKGLAHSSGYEADTVLPDSLKPSRQPYEGFVWDEVRGAGLRLLAQRNGSMRVMADPSLPGMVLVRDGSARHAQCAWGIACRRDVPVQED